ncbi:MAG: hypothetical protein ACI8UO_002071 [Verrucomicrobiales bacterium]|jgi:hypothetical protein
MILEDGMIGLDQPWWVILCALTVGHMIGDYPLQGDFIAVHKNHRLPRENSKYPDKPRGLWFHCLTAHSIIQAGIVWAITGLFVLALAEFVLHWVIDFLKSEGWTNFHVDQFLHIACKGGFVALIYYDMIPPSML